MMLSKYYDKQTKAIIKTIPIKIADELAVSQ
jgi:hypothetical protein